MSTHTTRNEVLEHSLPITDTPEQAACRSSTCSTGVCSPCIVIWGLVALYLFATTLLESFQ